MDKLQIDLWTSATLFPSSLSPLGGIGSCLFFKWTSRGCGLYGVFTGVLQCVVCSVKEMRIFHLVHRSLHHAPWSHLCFFCFAMFCFRFSNSFPSTCTNSHYDRKKSCPTAQSHRFIDSLTYVRECVSFYGEHIFVCYKTWRNVFVYQNKNRWIFSLAR